MLNIKSIISVFFGLFISISTLNAQVRTQFDDIEVIISGKTEIQTICVDDFFRSLEFDKDWEYYIVADWLFSFDIRWTTDLGLYFSLKNKRYSSDKDFGQGIIRSQGTVLGTQNLEVQLDELFIDLKGVIWRQLSLKSGLIHKKIGLDTSEKNWFEGHGALFFDSSTGRIGEKLDTEMFPAGIYANWNSGTGLIIDGGWYFLRKDTESFKNDIQLGTIEVKYKLTENSVITGGFAAWLERGNYFQTTYTCAATKIDNEFSTYGAFFYQSGKNLSATGFYVAIRYVSGDSLFVDFSYWYLSGNLGSTTIDESFRSTASLRTTMIIDNADFGLGAASNYSAFKLVVGMKLSWNMQLFGVAGIYSAVSSAAGLDPGNEIDLRYRIRFGNHLFLEGAAGYIFGSSVFFADSDGWLFLVRAVSSF